MASYFESNYVVSIPHFQHWHARDGALWVVFSVTVYLNGVIARDSKRNLKGIRRETKKSIQD